MWPSNGEVESLPPSEASGAPVELNSGSDAANSINEADDAGSELPSPPEPRVADDPRPVSRAAGEWSRPTAPRPAATPRG